jgi:membrane-associated phospholipid phosphatase
MFACGIKNRMRLFRSPEIIAAAYFTYTSALSLTLPVPGRITRATLLINAIVIAGLLLNAFVYRLRKPVWYSVLRDWYLAPLMLLAYRQMGWFAPQEHTFELERGWIIWDRWFLYDLGVKAAIEATGPVLPSLLEISYSLVYAIAPFSMVLLSVYGYRRRVSAFLAIFLPGIFFSYILFPYFPSEPPWRVFPGQDSPAYDTIFREFNRFLLGGYGIRTSVFPSAHVSGAFSGAFAMLLLLPERRWPGILLTILAVLIAMATVYGRYHYVVDAAAGLVVAAVASGAGTWFARRELARGIETPGSAI